MRMKMMAWGLVLAAALSGPGLADDKTDATEEAVIGVWQPPDKLSDYEIRICDEDSRAICLKVVGLRGAAAKPKYLAYMGKDIVENATPTGPGRWRGKLHLFGQEADGTLTMKSADSMELNGCAFVVICDKVMLTRAATE